MREAECAVAGFVQRQFGYGDVENGSVGPHAQVDKGICPFMMEHEAQGTAVQRPHGAIFSRDRLVDIGTLIRSATFLARGCNMGILTRTDILRGWFDERVSTPFGVFN